MIIEWILLAVIIGLIILCFSLRDHLYPDEKDEDVDIKSDFYRTMSNSDECYFDKVANECHGTDGFDDDEEDV